MIANTIFEGDIDEEIKSAYVKQLNEENTTLLENYYIDMDTFYQLYYGYEPGQYAKELMESVSVDIKYSYVLDKIVETEKLVATPEEIDAYINSEYIEYFEYGSAVEAFSIVGEENVRSYATTAVLREKAEKLIYDSADIKEI